MIDEKQDSREEAYRRVVEGRHFYEGDLQEVSSEIQELERERMGNQRFHEADESISSTKESLEHDPFRDLSEEELRELELSPEEIDFPQLSAEQQKRYWSLLSPGEKLRLVRSHLHRDLESYSAELRLPIRILKHLEQDNFALLPSASQVREYYRIYCDAMGLESQPLIEQYEQLTGIGSLAGYEELDSDVEKGVNISKLRLPLFIGVLLLVGFILGWFFVSKGPVIPGVLEEPGLGGVTYEAPTSIGDGG